MHRLLCLWLLLVGFAAPPLLPLAGAAPDTAPVRELRIEPSDTKVPLGHARLSVEPLAARGDGLAAGYKVDVSPLRIGSEAGQLTVAVSAADLRRLAGGERLEFSGQAVSTAGNTSAVHGTATPGGADAGAVKVRVEGKRGKLVFNTTYHLTR